MPRLFIWLVLALVTVSGLTIVAAIVAALFIFIGGPGSIDACENRPVIVESSLADDFQRKWDAFDANLDAGNSGTVAFNESEISSRAQSFLDDKNAPIKDVVVCIYAGSGEGRGKIDIGFLDDIPGIGAVFGDANVKVTGTATFSGRTLQVQIEDIEVGSVPGFIGDRIKGTIRRIINDQLDDLDIEHQYSLDLTPGTATIEGSP